MCVIFFLVELIADPTKCRVLDDEDTLKLEDVASQSNGISELTIFGLIQGRNSLFISFDNIDSSEYYGLSKQITHNIDIP